MWCTYHQEIQACMHNFDRHDSFTNWKPHVFNWRSHDDHMYIYICYKHSLKARFSFFTGRSVLACFNVKKNIHFPEDKACTAWLFPTFVICTVNSSKSVSCDWCHGHPLNRTTTTTITRSRDGLGCHETLASGGPQVRSPNMSTPRKEFPRNWKVLATAMWSTELLVVTSELLEASLLSRSPFGSPTPHCDSRWPMAPQ